MKISYLLLLLGVLFKAQEKLPFNKDLLEHMILPDYGNDSIFPTYRNEAFEYINIKTGKILFNKKFKEAYPFAGKSALIFDTETQSYNAIDRNGNFLLQQKNINQVFPLLNCSEAHVKFNYTTNKNYTESLFFYFYEGIMKGCTPKLPPKVPGEPIRFPFPFEKNDKNTYILKNNGTRKEKFDKVRVLSENTFLAMKNNKIGIIDNEGKFIVPLEFDESTVEFSENRNGYNSIIPLKKDEIWYYYGHKGQFILKSAQLCISHISPYYNSKGEKFGVYKSGEKYNILYQDGGSLEHDYDWISENGILASIGNNFYFIKQDRTAFPYYVRE